MNTHTHTLVSLARSTIADSDAACVCPSAVCIKYQQL